MTKELEALNIIKFNPDDVDGLQYLEAFKVVEQALQRLEAIDNANPSEALERIKSKIIVETEIKVNKEIGVVNPYYTDYLIIKQALLKAKEYNDVLKKYNLENIEELEKILKIFFMRGER